jgi:hypothetical protein
MCGISEVLAVASASAQHTAGRRSRSRVEWERPNSISASVSGRAEVGVRGASSMSRAGSMLAAPSFLASL